MRYQRGARSVLGFTAACFIAACASSTVASDNDSARGTPGKNTAVNPPAGQSQASDWAAIEKLEAEAKAIARASGCSNVSECRSAPVGEKACGGPRYFIPYCSKTTDSAALYRKLDEVITAERAYNKKHNVVSTCEMRLPPDLTLTRGACAAK
jgi:hypothetical protein